jgi:hypothetical protein
LIFSIHNIDKLSKQTIFDVQSYDKIFQFTDDDDACEHIKSYKILQSEQIENLKEKLCIEITEQLNELNTTLLEAKFKQLGEFETITTQLESIKQNIFEDDEKSNQLFRTVNKLTKTKEQELKDELVKKTYIIDTNVFVDEPNILDWIIGKNYAVVSGKVVDELDNLKKREDLKSNVGRATRNIKIAQNKKQIRTSIGKKELLPDDFEKGSADNLILSVALMYQKKDGYNPVLLTSDNAFQVKANMLDIRTIDLVTFLKENPKAIIETPKKEEKQEPKRQQDNRKPTQGKRRVKIKNRKPKKR